MSLHFERVLAAGIALGLTVTLVWLYMEILRLLSYFNRN